MSHPLVIAYSGIALLFIYQLWVTVMVWRADEYDAKQRILQCLAIWLLPFFAVLICHLMLRNSRAPIKPANTNVVDQCDNVGAENHGSGSATD
jgi:hypothetical protein